MATRPAVTGPGAWASTAAHEIHPGLELVAVRRLLSGSVIARVDLAPGDRALVGTGEPVIAGAPLAERLRDAQLTDTPVMPGEDPRRPGDRLSTEGPGTSLRRAAAAAGELVFRSGRRWRVATGEVADPIEAPAAGIVREVRSGTGIGIELAGVALMGAFAVGVPTRGRLALGPDAGGDGPATSLDVGRAGTILVIGSRVDAESLTRARAMGVRGVVVAAMSGKEVRDFAASERRQQAALHRLPPFAVLVLDGVVRRPIASPVVALLESLAGREVGIVTEPPALVIPGDEPVPPAVPSDWVRVRSGPLAGREGTWAGALGPRRFPPGVHLEAGLVEFADGMAAAVPLADLERYE
jgi:hypothetical protein